MTKNGQKRARRFRTNLLNKFKYKFKPVVVERNKFYFRFAIAIPTYRNQENKSSNKKVHKTQDQFVCAHARVAVLCVAFISWKLLKLYIYSYS